MITNPIWDIPLGCLFVLFKELEKLEKESVYRFQLKIDELCIIITATLLQNIETLSYLT